MAEPSPRCSDDPRHRRLQRWTGKAVAWLILPLFVVAHLRGFARYLFDAPTLWAYDLSYMLYGAIFMLGAALRAAQGRPHPDRHAVGEVLRPQRRASIDAIAYIFFFFPAMVLLFYASVDEAWHAWRMGELSEQTAWRPILWPFKAVVPLTALLLLIQGVSELLKIALRGPHRAVPHAGRDDPDMSGNETPRPGDAGR